MKDLNGGLRCGARLLVHFVGERDAISWSKQQILDIVEEIARCWAGTRRFPMIFHVGAEESEVHSRLANWNSDFTRNLKKKKKKWSNEHGAKGVMDDEEGVNPQSTEWYLADVMQENGVP
jgi:hypothetical protein